MNLERAKEVNEILEIALKEVPLERDEEKQCMKKLEQRLKEVFQTIPYNALAGEFNAKEKIQKIAHSMDNYKQ
jgi:hypothetical protein